MIKPIPDNIIFAGLILILFLCADNTAQAQPRQENPENDSLFASMERTSCYGTCPVYVMEIFESGYVVYTGIRFVGRIGVYSTRLSAEELHQLKEKALEAGYFELEDKYDSDISDIPAAITYLKADGKKKKIENRWGSPNQLRGYERYFDDMFRGKEWKLISEKVER